MADNVRNYIMLKTRYQLKNLLNKLRAREEFLAAKRKPSAQPLFTAVLPSVCLSVCLSVWELVGYVPDIAES